MYFTLESLKHKEEKKKKKPLECCLWQQADATHQIKQLLFLSLQMFFQQDPLKLKYSFKKKLVNTFLQAESSMIVNSAILVGPVKAIVL